jgi:hypothetical protein
MPYYVQVSYTVAKVLGWKVFFWVPLGRQQIQQTRNQQIQMIGATIWRFER